MFQGQDDFRYIKTVSIKGQPQLQDSPKDYHIKSRKYHSCVKPLMTTNSKWLKVESKGQNFTLVCG